MNLFLLVFFFTREVVCSFAYQHVANWNTTRITSEETCMLLLISEEDALLPCSLHSARRLLRNKEASWSLHETSLMCLAPVMSRDSSFLMAWFYRQINHGSLFLRPCLRLYTGDTAVPLLSNSNSTNTNPIGTEANAAGRSENARMQRKQSKCGMIQEGEGHWPNSSKKMQKARYLWVLQRASKEARDMRNTRSTRQWSKCTFQRARRLLFCIVLPLSHERLWRDRNSFAVSGVAVNRKPPLKNKNKSGA